jgi:hypothetical protein
MGLREIQMMKEAAKLPKIKKSYSIPKKSAKRIAQEKEEIANADNKMDKWFEATRKKLVGTCQCGCGNPSQKKDDTFYRHCCCHIFPKRTFESVKYHPLNYVERSFWGGCHSVLDDTSMDRWPGMADWFDIVEKFHVLAPLLTDEERATKFYSHLEKLIYK